MIAIVSGDVVAAVVGCADARKLHQLLNHACEGRHVVMFDPPECIESWLELVDSGTRDAYREALDSSTRRFARMPNSASVVYVHNSREVDWGDPVASLPLDNALELLSEPLAVLVENSGNDWHFLLGLMRGTERELVDKSLARGWLQILHGGGANVPAQIDQRASTPRTRLRTFAVFDSDRRHPDEHDPMWQPSRQEACTGYQIEQKTQMLLPGRYWMLRRRFIESYMPRSELRGLSGNANPEAADAFFRMPELARWYYNMKKGFRGDEPVENRHRCRDLFDAVSDDDRAFLRGGFGRIADKYVEASTRQFDWDAAARMEASVALPALLRLL